MNTRRQFLIRAPLGVARRRRRLPRRAGDTVERRRPRAAAGDARRAADVRHGRRRRARGVAGDVRRGGEAGAGDDDARRARAGGGELAQVDGAAASSAAPGRARWRSTPTLAPATLWNPMLPPASAGAARATGSCASTADPAPLPAARRRHRLRAGDAALALDRVAASSRSERLTNIYLDRIERFDPKLRCVITLTQDHALAQAKQADAEIAAGQVSRSAARHPVRREGPARHRRTSPRPTAPSRSATACPRRTPRSCARLDDAGAVLIAKLSLGALALNDIWFGGQTMNPWLLEEGASGSSAGPGAATAAGLVGFSIGSETGGSIVEPGDALRRDRPAADVRPRAAHRRDDALLVARQARPDDARRWRTRCSCCRRSPARTRATSSSVPSRLDFDATAPVDGTARSATSRSG